MRSVVWAEGRGRGNQTPPNPNKPSGDEMVFQLVSRFTEGTQLETPPPHPPATGLLQGKYRIVKSLKEHVESTIF